MAHKKYKESLKKITANVTNHYVDLLKSKL